jgi:hypothetical protein
MMVGRTWKAKMEPKLGGESLPNAPELGRPSWPKRTLVPAAVAGEHVVDHAAGPGHGALAVVEAQHEEGEVNCRPRPQATVRQRMRLRLVEPSQAASSTARIPSTPVNRSKGVSFGESEQWTVNSGQPAISH